MFFGVSALQTFHVLISLLGIVAGLWLAPMLVAGRSPRVSTFVFLASTLITTLTGFLLPIKGFTPAVGTGIVSLGILAVAFWARYGAAMKGHWRGAYVVSAVAALYLNVFVLVAQLFLKVPALKALAPGGTEPPFLIAQAATLAAFIGLGVLAWRGFRPGVVQPAE